MKKSAILAAATLLSASSTGFAASMHSLSKDQVIDALQDKTIVTIPMVTVDGKLANNTATIYLSKDNKVTGQFATKPESEPQADTGTWEVRSSGTLCVNWQNWNQHKPVCVYVYKPADGLIFINAENNKFESMVLADNIKSGNKISAQ